MSIYVKKDGAVKPISKNIVKMFNDRWFMCTRTIEDGIEYYTVDSSINSYIRSFSPETLYAFGFNEPNETTTPKLRLNGVVLDIVDITRDTDGISIGQLKGVFQMYTQVLENSNKIYFCGDTHKDEGIVNATVETLEANEEAFVETSGQAGEITLNFGIPRGMPALMTGVHLTGDITIGTIYPIPNTEFNRTPTIGDRFIAIVNSVYIGTFEITNDKLLFISAKLLTISDLRVFPLNDVYMICNDVRESATIFVEYTELNRTPIIGDTLHIYDRNSPTLFLTKCIQLGEDRAGFSVISKKSLQGLDAIIVRDILPIRPSYIGEQFQLNNSNLFETIPKIGQKFWAYCENNIFAFFETMQVYTDSYDGSSIIYIQFLNGINLERKICPHPIGAIIENNLASFDPSVYWDGTTWEELSQNQVTWSVSKNDSRLGKTIEAGLPDVRLTFAGINAKGSPNVGKFAPYNTDNVSGAASMTNIWNGITTQNQNSSTDVFGHIDVKASQDNKLYGKSNTVQPPAYGVRRWVRIA